MLISFLFIWAFESFEIQAYDRFDSTTQKVLSAFDLHRQKMALELQLWTGGRDLMIVQNHESLYEELYFLYNV